MLFCTKCWALLPVAAANSSVATHCPACAASIEAKIFPAFYRSRQSLAPRVLGEADDLASCFYHSTKRAASACTRCGKFLCSLCSLEVASEIWCPACLSNGSRESGTPALITKRTLWDSIALGCAVLPTVFFVLVYFWIFTAPATIFLSLRYWRRPTSIIPRTKVRFILAMLIALLQLALIGLFVYSILRSFGLSV